MTIWIQDSRILLFDAAWKSAIVLTFAFLAAHLLRNRAAALRHSLWTAVLLSLLVLPAIRMFGTTKAFTTVITIPASFGRGVPDVASRTIGWNVPLAWLWAAGGAFVLARLAFAILWSHRLTRSSQPLDSGWPALNADRYSIRQSERISVPLVTGILRTRMILPSVAREWPIERLREVVTHEIAHIQRRDCLINVVTEFVCAAFWFQPLIWLAARRRREEAEAACDDSVLAAGASPADYARHLLFTARSLRASRIRGTAAAVVTNCSRLEKRLRAILESRRDRSRLTFPKAIPVLASVPLCVWLLSSLNPAIAQSQPDKSVHKIGENGVTAPKLIYKVEPQYTDEAKEAKVEGTVVLSVEIDTDGLAKNIEIVRGLDPGLDQNGIEAVGQWRFKPAEKSGEPVRVAAKIEINFRLQ